MSFEQIEMFQIYNHLKDFRKKGVTCINYNKQERAITLRSGNQEEVTLSFSLIDYRGFRQLIFYGDIIAGDKGALLRLIDCMRDQELPVEFSKDEVLRKQLYGDASSAAQKASPICFGDIVEYVVGR